MWSVRIDWILFRTIIPEYFSSSFKIQIATQPRLVASGLNNLKWTLKKKSSNNWMMKDKISQVQMLVFSHFLNTNRVLKKMREKNYRVKFVRGITLHFGFFCSILCFICTLVMHSLGANAQSFPSMKNKRAKRRLNNQNLEIYYYFTFLSVFVFRFRFFAML